LQHGRQVDEEIEKGMQQHTSLQASGSGSGSGLGDGRFRGRALALDRRMRVIVPPVVRALSSETMLTGVLAPGDAVDKA